MSSRNFQMDILPLPSGSRSRQIFWYDSRCGCGCVLGLFKAVLGIDSKRHPALYTLIVKDIPHYVGGLRFQVRLRFTTGYETFNVMGS